MFRTLELFSAKNIVVNEKIHFLFSPSSLNVFPAALNSRNYANSASQRKNVEDEIQFSKLKNIEKLKGLEKQQFTTKSRQDIICRFILQKNITVPNLIGCTKNTTNFHRSSFRNLPSTVSYKKFDAEEDNIIVKNIETLVKKTKMKSLGDILEIDHRDEHRVTRMEIIGSYLSQGMPKIRIPNEVFDRARKLIVCPKGELTETEKRIIDEHLKSKENFNKWSSLERKLDRSPSSIKQYAMKTLQNKEKTKRGRFSLEESKKVLDHVFAANKNALLDAEYINVTSNVWSQLANNLKRPYINVYNHWTGRLQPLLTRYEANVLDVDFRIPLLQHCISEDIKYPQNANWLEISKNPKFVGTTPVYLGLVFKITRMSTKAKNKELKDHEITSEVMLQFLMTIRAYKKQNDQTCFKKWEKDVLVYYDNVIKKRL